MWYNTGMKAACIHGHLLVEGNLFLSSQGYWGCRQCRKDSSARTYQKYRKDRISRSLVHHHAVRRQVLEAYGSICSRCGFADERALQLDHVKGGGYREYKELRGRLGVYKRALTHLSEYQLLCANCNWIKRVENNEIGKGN